MNPHLVAVQTRSDRLQRKQKLSLVGRLYQQGFEREDVLKTVNIGRGCFRHCSKIYLIAHLSTDRARGFFWN
ncbi:MAG: hypothetical protein V7K54_00090 [Nostoc sp.]